MTVEQQLMVRSNNVCELCASGEPLIIYTIPPDLGPEADKCLLVCKVCNDQLEKKYDMDPAHWHCLRETMWSEVPAIQVVSWRLLNRLKNETWASDAIDLMYLDEELLLWATASGDHMDQESVDRHRDCNGALLQTGDTVTLIKSLDIKGSQINAKIGTVVKNIRVVSDNTDQIEGKIEGQQIVILTKFVRKS
ncbi:MAG: PhnA domain-containing protein [Bacteroidota bacterium]